MLLPYPYFDLWHRYANWIHLGLAIVVGLLTLSSARAPQPSPPVVHRPPIAHTQPIHTTPTQPHHTPVQPTPPPCHPTHWLEAGTRHHLHANLWQSEHASAHSPPKSCWRTGLIGPWVHQKAWLIDVMTQGAVVQSVQLARATTHTSTPMVTATTMLCCPSVHTNTVPNHDKAHL